MRTDHAGTRGGLRRAVAAVLLPAALLAGCSGDRSDTATGPIVFADGRDTSLGGQIKQLVARWNQHHPAEQVRMVELPESADDHRAQLVAGAQDATAGGPCYDVVTTDVVWTAEFARWGYLLPLDPGDFDAAAFLRKPLDSARYQGRLWAVPLRSDIGLLYYRTDLLAAMRARPPRTWSELRRLATAAAAEHDVAGLVSQFDRYEGFTVNVLESIWAADGELLTGDGEIRARSAAARTGVGRLREGFSTGWIPRQAAGYNEERSRIAFQDRGALFLRNWTYAYRLLSSGTSPVEADLGVAPLPGPSALGGWNVGVSRCSQRRGTARAFIKFLTAESSQRTLFEQAGFAPSRAALYSDAGLRARYPHLRVLRESIERSRNRPVTPYYDQVSGAVQDNLHALLSTSPATPVETALNNLADDLRTAAEGR